MNPVLPHILERLDKGSRFAEDHAEEGVIVRVVPLFLVAEVDRRGQSNYTVQTAVNNYVPNCVSGDMSYNTSFYRTGHFIAYC